MTRWDEKVTSLVHQFQNDLVVVYKSGYFDVDANKTRAQWSFVNSMFYCGTIYTTIGKFVFLLLIFQFNLFHF